MKKIVFLGSLLFAAACFGKLPGERLEHDFRLNLAQTFVASDSGSEHCLVRLYPGEIGRVQFYKYIVDFSAKYELNVLRVDHIDYAFFEFPLTGSCPPSDGGEDVLWGRLSSVATGGEAKRNSARVILEARGEIERSVKLSAIQGASVDEAVRILSFGEFDESACKLVMPLQKKRKEIGNQDIGDYVVKAQSAARVFGIPVYFLTYDAEKLTYQLFNSCKHKKDVVELLDSLTIYL